MTPGIEIREIPSVVGERYFHEVFFSGRAGAGLDPASVKKTTAGRVVNYALQYERVGCGPLCARRRDPRSTWPRSLKRTRPRWTTPSWWIASGEARALCEAARVLSYKVIDLRAKGSPPSADTQLARVLGTRADNAIGVLALEIIGPEALEYGTFADSNFRLAMTAGVAVGATEVQLNLIASRFLGLPRE